MTHDFSRYTSDDWVGVVQSVEGSVGGNGILMKPAEGLKDEEIKGLVAYMRTFKK